MKIVIKEQCKPFSHLPGAACLIPGTYAEIQAFPTLLKIADHVIDLPFTGPVEGFTLELDLERHCVFVFGKAKEGYYKIRIEASSGLNEEDIQRMVKDAEAHEAEDKQKREEAEVRNQADMLVYSTEKTLKEHGDKIEAGEKAKVEASIEKLKKAIESNSTEEMKKGMEELQQASHKLAEMMYKEATKQQQAAQQAAAGAAQGAEEPKKEDTAAKKAEEDIVDADYEVVDEGKDQQ